MSFYQWDPNFLSVNVKEMDQEHQVLIEKMNRVYDFVNAKKSHQELDAVVTDFATYTVKHFKDEEAFMEKINFDGLKTHRIIHKQLLAEVTKHVEHFKTTGQFSEGFFKFLSVWLTSHIRGIDAKYGSSEKKVA